MNWHKILDIREGTYSSDFRLHNPLDNSRGDTYSDTEQSYTNLASHESIFEILDTINHETLHVALKREDMTIETEHIIIRKINQVLYEISSI